MNKINLSVSIISHNEEENIARTLESIRDIASEIIVVDSHSTDKTRDVASAFGAKVFEEDWKGFVDQKNSSLEKCTQEWILFLDCDEVLTDELKESILNAVNNPVHDGYYLNRRTFYLGKLLKFAWQPDKNLRLCKKSANPLWTGNGIHESLSFNSTTGELKGYLVHYSYKSISHHLEKTIYYAQQSAESYFKSGKQFRIINLLINPLIAFTKLYIIHKGFLDGIRGLIAGFSTYIYTFLKYIFLWELERNTKNLTEN